MRRAVGGLAATLALAGCGGGDERLTAAEYHRQGNAICVDLQKRLAAIERAGGRIDERGRKLSEISDDGTRKLLALRPPPELEAAGREFEAVIRELPKVARTAGPGDRLSALTARSNRALRRLGLDRCAPT